MRPTTIREDVARAMARKVFSDLEIKHPPVNIEQIIRCHKIVVRYSMLPDIHTSFTIKFRNKYYINIAVSGTRARDRWSLAHELGHIILGHYDLYVVDTVDEDRLTEKERYILDREADIFTEELLLPEEWVLKYNNPKKVKEAFDVSWEAASIRLSNLCSGRNVSS